MTDTTPDPETYKGTVLKILAKADESLPPREVMQRMEDEPAGGVHAQLSALVEEDRVEKVEDPAEKYGVCYKSTDKGEADVNIANTPDTSSPTDDAGGLSDLFVDEDEVEEPAQQAANGTEDQDAQTDTPTDGTPSDDHATPYEDLYDEDEVEAFVDALHEAAEFTKAVAEFDNIFAFGDRELTDLITAVATTDDLPRSVKRDLIAGLADAKARKTPVEQIKQAVGGDRGENIRKLRAPEAADDVPADD